MGSEAWIKVNADRGQVTTVELVDGGDGYPNDANDVEITIMQEGSTNELVVVCTTDHAGVVVSVDSIADPGDSYAVENSLSSDFEGLTGTPATFNIKAVTPGTGNNITTGRAGWLKAISLTPGSTAATLVVADAATVTGTKLWHLQARANGPTSFLNLGNVGVKFDTGVSYTLVGTGAFAELYYTLA